MLSQLVTYGKFGQLFCSIEHTTSNGKESLNGLLLKKKKEEFLIENTFESDAITNLNQQLKKGQHLFLIINDARVLSKTINETLNTKKTLAKAFPNLNAQDFYYETYTTNTSTFIAICRKDVIDNIINTYTKEGFNIIGFSLGNLIISQLNKLHNESTLLTSNSKVNYTNQEIVSFTPDDKGEPIKHTINGLNISNQTVLPLAGILAYFTQQNTTETNFHETLEQLNDNFKQKRIFTVGTKFILSTIFTLLLFSFLFFTNYAAKIQTINSELELNKTYKNTLIALSDKVGKKERLVKDFSLTSSKASWYLDQIGISIPSSILLSEIQFQPLVKKIKENQQILVQENILTIKGRSNHSIQFSEWIKTLEKQDWLKKMSIQNYGTGKKMATEFELKIELKP